MMRSIQIHPPPNVPHKLITGHQPLSKMRRGRNIMHTPSGPPVAAPGAAGDAGAVGAPTAAEAFKKLGSSLWRALVQAGGRTWIVAARVGVSNYRTESLRLHRRPSRYVTV